MSHTDELALTIAEKIADREGVDSTELHPPLHETIDTDALESLIESATRGRAQATVTFAYHGYTIQVDSSGAVRVSKTRSESASTAADA
ncbi:HalOD1 output domain-containing protein [Natribaculum luteum]|uniref:HalOD1 output domain-containing protein n=1 Tax=Natribaculum luteum TaxID=1586232 RepID=A0ABD5NU72_9EURY|nr:HalOD1 output domain-containing protein [Natribaculum luteum]